MSNELRIWGLDVVTLMVVAAAAIFYSVGLIINDRAVVRVSEVRTSG
jgi:hypothetical protein